MPALDALLRAMSSSMRDIHGIIVSLGPGSFTGLRVGVSTAKGLAHSLRIPLMGVSSLEAMAHQIPYAPFPICPIIESRKGEVFSALFKWADDGSMIRLKEDVCLSLAELPSFIKEATLIVGNDFVRQATIVRTLALREALLVPSHLWNIRASVVGKVGLLRFHAQDYDNLQDLVPRYLRPPDIRPNPYSLIQEYPRNNGKADHRKSGRNIS
jgi:tRNA threonylcarbamoyladenosine biosynthesis protein TsaB